MLLLLSYFIWVWVGYADLISSIGSFIRQRMHGANC